jgi:hypothetical protein
MLMSWLGHRVAKGFVKKFAKKTFFSFIQKYIISKVKALLIGINLIMKK